MAKYLILDANGVAVNCIEWDGKARWSPPDGYVLKPVGDDCVFNQGWVWDGQKLNDPTPPKVDDATKGMSVA